MEILAISPKGNARNDFIEENIEIITLPPVINKQKVMGAHYPNEDKEKSEDPTLVQQLLKVNLAKTNEKPLFKEWFYIRQSDIEKSGVGVFAAKEFRRGDYLGVYAGKHKKKPGYSSPYYMYSEENQYGIDGYSSKPGNPILLGLHLANDYYLHLILADAPDWNQYRRRKNAPEYNMYVNHNFVCFAKRNIKKGEEIYLHYDWCEEDTAEGEAKEEEAEDDEKKEEDYVEK